MLIAQATPQVTNEGTSLGRIRPPSDQFGSAASATDTNSLINNFESLISTGIGMLTVLGGIFFIVFFFLAALKWLTAGGDAGKVQKARDEMVQGVIGLIILVAAYGVIGLIGSVVGLQLLNPGDAIRGLLPRGG